MPRGASKNTSSKMAEQGSDLNDVLSQLATGMLSLQKSFESLAILVNRGPDNSGTSNKNDLQYPSNSYILLWKELGGPSICYTPNGKLHPEAFIRRLKKIFLEAGVPESHKISLAISCFRGTASDWASIKENSFVSFDDFEIAFISRFWNIEKQRDLYLNLCYGRYENGSRSEYFSNLVNQASYLSEPVPGPKLIHMISKHFPAEIQRGIATLGLKSFDEVDEYLRSIDEAGTDVRTVSVGDNRRRQNFNDNRERDRRYHTDNVEAQRGNAVSAETVWRNPRDTPQVNSGPMNSACRLENTDSEGHVIRNITSEKVPIFCDDTNLLLSASESDGEIEEGQGNYKSPIIKVKIQDIVLDAIIDSGSDVTVVSEELYNGIKCNRIPVLPVSGVAISTAVGKKRQRIKQQVCLSVVLLGNEDIEFNLNCLIVPGLNCQLLLGCDWLLENKVKVDFSNNAIKIMRNNEYFSVAFNSEVMESNCYALNVYLDSRESIVNEHETVRRHCYGQDEVNAIVEQANTTTDVKKQLCDLLMEHQGLFSENPGCVRSYEHRIEMVDETPFHGSSYPVPFAYRSEVRKQIVEMEEWGGRCEEHPIMKMIKFPVDSQPKPSLHDVWILAREKLLSKAERRMEKHNSKNNLVEFQEFGIISCPQQDHTIRKFFLLFSGPYRISRKAGPNSYVLVDAEGKEMSKQNVVNLKSYKELPSEF
nr:unnamed protein product [Callosobruchus analis]